GRGGRRAQSDGESRRRPLDLARAADVRRVGVERDAGVLVGSVPRGGVPLVDRGCRCGPSWYSRRGMIKPNPITLEGHGVRLEPLADQHHDELLTAAADGKLWELWFTSVP